MQKFYVVKDSKSRFWHIVMIVDGKMVRRTSHKETREEAEAVALSWGDTLPPKITPKTHACEVCGTVFKHRIGRNANRTCSRKCGDVLLAGITRERYLRDHFNGHMSGQKNDYPPAPKVCMVCKGSFLPTTRAEQKTCSPICRRVSGAGSVLESVRECSVCGKEFIRPYGRGTKNKCSPACQEANARQINREVRRRRRHRMRAASAGVAWEEVSHAAIFERDGYQCGICGGLTDERKEVPHPDAPTLDHIVPLSKGGAHVPGNLQCAHFLCNSRKGDSTDIKFCYILT